MITQARGPGLTYNKSRLDPARAAGQSLKSPRPWVPQSRGTLNWSFSLRMALMVVTGSDSPACCCTDFSLHRQEIRTGWKQSLGHPQAEKQPGLGQTGLPSNMQTPTQPRVPELHGPLKKLSKSHPSWVMGPPHPCQDVKKSVSSHLWNKACLLGTLNKGGV